MARGTQETVKVVDVVVVDALYPRPSLNDILVNRYIAAHEAGAVFPPIIVERGTNRLVDGRHRLDVFRRKEVEKIPVEFRVYETEADLFAEAVRLNKEHGQPLTFYDLKSAILRLETMGYSRDKISGAVGWTRDKVEAVAKQSATSESSGEPVALKGGLRHVQGQALTDNQVAAVKRYSGGQAVFYIRQLAMLLDNDLWPAESAMARTEMDKLVSRWEERYPRLGATG
jgi:hypothetical protein